MRNTVRVVVAGVGAVVMAAGQAFAQTPSVDELVAKHLAARGGLEKLQSVSTMRLQGTMQIQGMDMPLTVLSKRPNKMRQEMTMQGQTVVQAYDGQTVWAINPMMGGTGPQAIDGPPADAVKSQSLFDGPLVGYKDRGDTLEVVGPADVAGARTWKLKLTRQDGRSMLIYLDAETGLEKQWSATMEQGGMTMEIDTIMSDHQPVDGIQVARTMRTLVGGQAMGALTVSSVEFNVPIDDAVFSMPR
jgi:outer membrane lipoprotein-sorting protein